MKSDVYLAKVTSAQSDERSFALEKILKATDFSRGYKKDEFIPVKITLGDSSCIYNLKPELVKVVISEIKKRQAKPFLFDTSVIYKGERQNAVDHLSLAQSKGFAYNRVAAPFIVADGLLGQDGKEYNIQQENIKRIKVPSFIGMLENLVVLSHATGHIVSGYAGSIKNVAMGMSCRPTKQVQHSSLKPSVILKNCTACGCCIKICPPRAIAFKEDKAFIDQNRCIGCGECLCACKFDAISINWEEDPKIFCRRMAEVASFILSKFKNKFFITFALDITKECDCISTKDDTMIAGDLGIFAGKDVVAVDKAVADYAYKNKQSEFLSRTRSIYEDMFSHAEKIGLGNTEYNVIEI